MRSILDFQQTTDIQRISFSDTYYHHRLTQNRTKHARQRLWINWLYSSSLGRQQQQAIETRMTSLREAAYRQLQTPQAKELLWRRVALTTTKDAGNTPEGGPKPGGNGQISRQESPSPASPNGTYGKRAKKLKPHYGPGQHKQMG